MLLCFIIAIASVFYPADASRCKFTNLPQVKNGDLDDFSARKGFAIFSCDEGYVVESTDTSTQTIKCTPNGWGKVKPCEKQKVSCRTPKSLANRFPSMKKRYLPGENVIVKCPKDYRLRGPAAKLLCKEDGSWSNRISNIPCKRDTCKVPGVWKQTVEELLKDESWPGQKITVTCPKPNQMDAKLKAKGGKITCLRGGKWDMSDTPLCKTKGKICSVPETWMKYFGSGLFRKYEYLPRAKVILAPWPKTLIKSREIKGTDYVITCQENGKWDVKSPFKIVKGCTVPRKWQKGLRGKSILPVGYHKRIGCPQGHEYTPSIKRTNGQIKCLPNGKWNIRNKGFLCRRRAFCVIPLEWRVFVHGLGRAVVLPGGKAFKIKCKRGAHPHPSLARHRNIVSCNLKGKWNVRPGVMVCTNRRFENAKSCQVPRYWKRYLRLKQNTIRGGIRLNLNCGGGTVMSASLRSARGQLLCNSRTGRWNVDVTQNLCVRRT